MADDSLRPAIAAFEQEFARWSLRIPEADIAARRAGHLTQSSWSIFYRFDRDDEGEFLDYYAAHRVAEEERAANDHHVRLYASGVREVLPPVLDAFLYSRDPTDEELSAARSQHGDQKFKAGEPGGPSQAASLLLDEDLLGELERAAAIKRAETKRTEAKRADTKRPSPQRVAPLPATPATPLATTPSAVTASATTPSATTPSAATLPAAKTAATKPTATKPAATQTAAPKPAAPKPAAAKPAVPAPVAAPMVDATASPPAPAVASTVQQPKAAEGEDSLQFYFPPKAAAADAGLTPRAAELAFAWPDTAAPEPEPVRAAVHDALDDDELEPIEGRFEFNPLRRHVGIGVLAFVVLLGGLVAWRTVGGSRTGLPGSAESRAAASARNDGGRGGRSSMLGGSRSGSSPDMDIASATPGGNTPSAANAAGASRAGVQLDGTKAIPIRPGEITPIEVSDELPAYEPTVFSRGHAVRTVVPRQAAPRSTPHHTRRTPGP